MKSMAISQKIVFPGADEAALAKLVSASSVASFGKGNHCDAYEIDPDKFMTSFYPCNAKVLHEIESLMVPNRSCIRAELYKLNLYTGPGGYFKSTQVDAPRLTLAGDMFGSLVVCLPTQFSGGALVTRYGDQEVVFDWSSTSNDPLREVCWAAYFSNVEHEILPVTSGHRLTLIYNLYVEQEKLHSVPPGSPFHNCLQRAVSTPQFMSNGGCLVFYCEHLYDFSSLNNKENLPHILKGDDHLIFSTAIMLNLRVTVKPISEGCGEYTSLLPYFPCSMWRHYRVDDWCDGEFCDKFDVKILQSTRWQMILDAIGSEDGQPIVIPADSIKDCSGGISWSAVFNLIKAPIKTTLEMLEEACTDMGYLEEIDEDLLQEVGVCQEDIPVILDACKQLECTDQQKRTSLGWILYSYNQEIPVCQSAVILIEVPPWGDPPRTLASDDQQPAEKKQKIKQEYRSLFDEDNKMLYCWKNNN